jgi:hypothetical protein
LGLIVKKLTGGWRKLHNESCKLHISPNTIRVGSNERRDGQVRRQTDMQTVVLYGKLNKEDQLEDLVIDRIILKTVFRLITCDM